MKCLNLTISHNNSLSGVFLPLVINPLGRLKYYDWSISNTLVWEESFRWLRNAAGPLVVPLIILIINIFDAPLTIGIIISENVDTCGWPLKSLNTGQVTCLGNL